MRAILFSLFFTFSLGVCAQAKDVSACSQVAKRADEYKKALQSRRPTFQRLSATFTSAKESLKLQNEFVQKGVITLKEVCALDKKMGTEVTSQVGSAVKSSAKECDFDTAVAQAFYRLYQKAEALHAEARDKAQNLRTLDYEAADQARNVLRELKGKPNEAADAKEINRERNGIYASSAGGAKGTGKKPGPQDPVNTFIVEDIDNVVDFMESVKAEMKQHALRRAQAAQSCKAMKAPAENP